MTKLNSLSFEKFYNKIQFFPDYWQSLMPATNINSDEEGDWIKRATVLDELSAQNHVAVFLWNAFSNRFIYMSDKMNVLGGYKSDVFTVDDGVGFSFSLVHPDQLNATLLLYAAGLNYGAKNGLKSHNKMVLSFNYRYKNAGGIFIQMLQQCTIVEADEQMQPRLVLSCAQNISHLKKEESVGLVISSPLGTEIINYDFDKKCLEAKKTFSAQETKIIQLLSQGIDTKKIANLLHLSHHTVSTHRRNLIKKTDCIDMTSVVTFAKLINLI